MFHALIKAGLKLDKGAVIGKTAGEKDYPIEFAIGYISLESIKLILNKGLDINKVYHGTDTAIDIAHYRNREEIELYLLENGVKYRKYKTLNTL